MGTGDFGAIAEVVSADASLDGFHEPASAVLVNRDGEFTFLAKSVNSSLFVYISMRLPVSGGAKTFSH